MHVHAYRTLQGAITMATTVLKRKPDELTFSGIWQFRQERRDSPEPVTISTLIDLAEDWARENPSYFLLQVRSCGTKQIGIVFNYMPGPDETLSDYTELMSDRLHRRFGNDLVGWSISDEVYTIET